MDTLERELIDLCNSHGISFASFCGKSHDNKFIGLLDCGTDATKAKVSDIMEVCSGVGRLWQHARQTTKTILDRYEGTWK